MTDLKMPRATPESCGLSTDTVDRLLHALETTREPRSLVLLRRWKLVEEKYWPPYTADSLHVCWSVTKTFVMTAVGMLVDEGKLHTGDRITDFFRTCRAGPTAPFEGDHTGTPADHVSGTRRGAPGG